MTNIAPPPLQLKYYFVEELHIKAILDRDKMAESDRATVLFHVKEDDVDASFQHAQTAGDTFKHRITLMVRSKPGITLPWSFVICLQGFFDLTPEFTAKPNAIDLLCVNGGSLLYTIAREVIFSGTSRGPHGAVFLPTIRFVPAPVPQPEVPVREKRIKKIESAPVSSK